MKLSFLTTCIFISLAGTSAFAQQAEVDGQVMNEVGPQYTYMSRYKANMYGLKARIAISEKNHIYAPVSYAVGDGIKQYFAGIGIGETGANHLLNVSFEAALAATTFDARYYDDGTKFSALFNTILTANITKRLAVSGYVNLDMIGAYQMYIDKKPFITDVSGAGLSLHFNIGSLRKK